MLHKHLKKKERSGTDRRWRSGDEVSLYRGSEANLVVVVVVK
jgi:hypothetical protein